MPTLGRRRAFGQHFLRDRGVAEAIARTACDEAFAHQARAFLEIGPGKGAITDPILEILAARENAPDFFICERDRKIADVWKTRSLMGKPPFRVEDADFLELPEEKWLAKTPLAVVSNLPYSTGTAILTRMARHFENIPVMVLMFQAEVAKRLRAEPDTREWGSLSIWIQNRWDVKKLLHVKPGAFAPPPDVDSEVVVLYKRKEPRVPVSGEAQEALWESLLKTAFAHRRKMLRSGIPPGPHRNALELAHLDGTKRAEALSWEEWGKFFGALLASGNNRPSNRS